MKKITKFSLKTNGLLNFQDLKSFHFKIMYIIMLIILVLVSLFCLLPTLWVSLSGFKSVQEMYRVPPTLFPEKIQLSSITNIWGKINFTKYFMNTIVLIVGCWGFDIVINGLAGYVLSRLKPMGYRIIEIMVFWAMLLPGISMVPLYMTFVDLGLVGSYMPVWMQAGASAFNILLFRNFFNSIPMSYLEAARIDGCSDGGAFWRIVLPLSKPIIMVESIFIITSSWGNFMWPYLILGNSDKEPVAVMLFKLSIGNTLRSNEYFMLIMLSIIPMIIVYAIFSKQIMGGLEMSGVKG